MEKVTAVLSAADGAPNLATSGPKETLVNMTKFGITYRGAPLADTVARSFLIVAPFVSNVEVRNAVIQFENVSKVLNDQTKLPQVLSAASKAHNGGQLGTENAATGAAHVIHALRISILYEEIANDKHITKEFMIGGRMKAATLIL